MQQNRVKHRKKFSLFSMSCQHICRKKERGSQNKYLNLKKKSSRLFLTWARKRFKCHGVKIPNWHILQLISSIPGNVILCPGKSTKMSDNKREPF